MLKRGAFGVYLCCKSKHISEFRLRLYNQGKLINPQLAFHLGPTFINVFYQAVTNLDDRD